jgi:hypothetical protein
VLLILVLKLQVFVSCCAIGSNSEAFSVIPSFCVSCCPQQYVIIVVMSYLTKSQILTKKKWHQVWILYFHFSYNRLQTNELLMDL